MARRRAEPRRARAAGRRPDAALGAGELALLATGFAALALAIYAPALGGPFLSDDLHYVATNPYVHDLSFENLLAILDPRSPATVFVVNYAPVHLLLHALTWQAVGEQTTAYHVINVLLHALGAALLAAVYARAGLPRWLALGGALLFLLHPANVEGVAWISQAKTPAAFALSMGALLAWPRRTGLATALFAFALLAKPTAVFALPVAALLDWTRERRLRPAWLGAWTLLLLGYAVAEFATHQRTGAAEPLDPDWGVRLRTSAAIVAHYAWMSATSLGVSAFHEPAPARAWLDPRWLAGLAICAAIAARSVATLRRRSPEVAFWAWAVVSFVPISQLFPFLYPMADRYLYFILPGLLGGTLFALLGGFRHLEARGLAPAWLPRAAAAAGLALAVAFGVHAFERARIWASPVRVLLDAAGNYPDGRVAQLAAARRAAQQGDADTAIAALREAVALGFNRYEQLQGDPALRPLHGDPRYEALVREVAGWWVERFTAKPDPTQIELRTLALAYLARGEREQAIRTLERALAEPGPLDDRLREEIAQLRALPRGSGTRAR